MQPDPLLPSITLFLAGDVMTGRGIDQVLPQPVSPVLYEDYVKDARDYVKLAEKQNGPIQIPVPYAYIWGDALAVWQQMLPDLKLVNLETSITTHPEPWPGKAVQYRMHPANTGVLNAAGIHFCSLANNHTLDWNRPGLLETQKALQQAGIAYAGAGENLAEAQKPAILKVRENRVLVFAFGSPTSGIPGAWSAAAGRSGLNLLPDFTAQTLEMISRQVKAVKQAGDLVVFSIHWGGNWGYDIPNVHRKFAHSLIDQAGIDLIYGHSSHHPLGLEVYKNKLILYGAGDFINDYEGIRSHEEFRGELSLMYFPKLDPKTGNLLSLEMVPMETRNFRLNKASSADARWLAGVLDRESRKFGTTVKVAENGVISASW